MSEAKVINLNKCQLLFSSYLPFIKNANIIGGRAIGKSSLIGLLMRKINEDMPRSSWVLQGTTYQQILTMTLPGTLAFLEKLGYTRNNDYYINRFPPEYFDLPYQCPSKPENCLFIVNHKLRTSIVFTLFSQDYKTSNRGPNRDGIIVDESLLIDKTKFDDDAAATNRGNEEYFGSYSPKPISYHHGTFHFSSMPAGKSYLFEMAAYYDRKFDFTEIREQIADIQIKFLTEKNKQIRLELWAEHNRLNKLLKYYPGKRDRVNELYCEFSTFDNIQNLGLAYIESLFEKMPLYIFEKEILCMRKTEIQGSFYPNLDPRIHYYRPNYDNAELSAVKDRDIYANTDSSKYDLDCLRTEALHIGLDFGINTNWLIVGQYLKSINKFRFLKDFYVKSPRMIDDIIKDFCAYYSTHSNRMIYLYPDGEGNIRRANVPQQLSYVDQIVKILKNNGWNVKVVKTDKYNGSNDVTYITWARCLSGRMPDLFPEIEFNEINCKDLLYSMSQTPAIDKGNKIKKDKSSEGRLKENRQEATDAGDAADQIIVTLFGKNNSKASSSSALMQKLFNKD